MVRVWGICERHNEKAIFNLPCSGISIRMACSRIPRKPRAIRRNGHLDASPRSFVFVSPSNPQAGLGIMSAASCEQQTQSYDCRCDFHSVSDDVNSDLANVNAQSYARSASLSPV